MIHGDVKQTKIWLKIYHSINVYFQKLTLNRSSSFWKKKKEAENEKIGWERRLLT